MALGRGWKGVRMTNDEKQGGLIVLAALLGVLVAMGAAGWMIAQVFG